MKLTKHIIVDEESGEYKTLFYDDNNLCESLEIDIKRSKIYKQISSYSLIKADLILLIKWTKYLIDEVKLFEEENKIKKYPDYEKDRTTFIDSANSGTLEKQFLYLSSICVIYGRLFTENSSRGLTLNYKDIERRFRNSHDLIIGIRKNYIAHSSDHNYEHSKIFIIFNPLNKSQFKIVYDPVKIYGIDSQSLRDFYDNLEALYSFVDKKLTILVEEVEKQYIKNNGLSIK